MPMIPDEDRNMLEFLHWLIFEAPIEALKFFLEEERRGEFGESPEEDEENEK